MLNSISSRIYMEETRIEECVQPNMTAPSVLSPFRNGFEDDFVEKGIEYVLKRYGDQGWRYKMSSFFKGIYQSVRQTIRKILGRR